MNGSARLLATVLLGSFIASAGCAHYVGDCPTDERLCLDSNWDADRQAFPGHLKRWIDRCSRTRMSGPSLFECIRVAQLLAGYDARGKRRLVERHAPAMLDPNLDQAMAIAGTQCDQSTRSPPEACAMLEILKVPGRLPSDEWHDAWVTPAVRLALVRRIVAEQQLAPEALAHAIKLGTHASFPGGSPEQAAHELAGIVGGLRVRAMAMNREATVRALARTSLPGWSSKPVDALIAELAALRLAVASWPDTERDTILRTIDRRAKKVLELALAKRITQGRFDGGDEVAEMARALGLPAEAEADARDALAKASAAKRDRERSDAAAIHEREAARHEAAGRYAAARVHGELAARFGSSRALVDPRLPAVTILVREVGERRCPWVALPDLVKNVNALATPSAVAAGQSTSTEVTLTWNACASEDRRWSTQDTYSYEVAEKWQEAQVCYVPTPGPPQKRAKYCPTGTACPDEYLSTTTKSTCYVERTKTTKKQATRTTQHREVASRVQAQIARAMGGKATVLANDSSLEEEAYETPHGRRAFTSLTPEAQRVGVAEEMVSAIHIALLKVGHEVRSERARTDLELGLRLANADPDGAEEALSRALLYDPSAGARVHLARRHPAVAQLTMSNPIRLVLELR